MTRRPPAPKYRWWWLLVFLLAGVVPGRGAEPPQEGEPFMQYFSPRDYHGGTQCMCAAQDARGVMYIGSLGLVLEYDGSAWRKIDIDSNWAASIAYEAATDTVFVGAQNNVGYLKMLPGGERKFFSLLDQLPADAREVGSVWGTFVTPEGVFFVGTHRLMRWKDGHFKTWNFPAASRLEGNLAGGVLYVSSPEIGLLRVEGDTLASVCDDPLFRRVAVASILAEADGALLIGTRDDGIFEWKDRVIRPWECECADFLKRVGIYHILRLRDGSLAVATKTAGLLVLDPARRFRNRVDEKSALHGKSIFELFEDAEGGLWICLQTGVARAEINSPFSILRGGPEDDLSSAYSYSHWFGAMVVGSHGGIYRVVGGDRSTAVGAHLEWLPGTTDSSTALCSVENGLLSVTDGKIFLLDAGAKLVPVAAEISDAEGLCASRVHPGRVSVIEKKGQISKLRFEGTSQKWVYDGVLADLGTSGGEFSLGESPRGDLWVWSTEHGLYRVELAENGPAVVTSFIDRPGPLQGDRNLEICGYDGSPLRIKGSGRLYGLDSSGRELRVLTEFGQRFCDGSFYFSEAAAYDEGSLWFTATDVRYPLGDSLRGRVIAGSKDHAPVFQPLPHRIEDAIGRPSIYYPVDLPPAPLTTMLLVGTTGNGLVRMDVPRWDALPPPRPFVTFIRRAVTVGGNSSTAEPPILDAPLPFARNSAHFEFAAATLAFGAAPRFQTRLVNFGAGEWSDLSDRNNVDYLNLPEGRYTFEVRARNSDGQFGNVGSFPFRILPPWQRTPWAYAIYALLLAAALAAFVRWRDWRLRRRNAALAALVDARTGELRAKQADLLANQQDLMRARDHAETANRAKSAFLANMSHELRTPLNAILGYTQIMLKHMDLPARTREQVAVIGQSGGHLLSLINEVLDLSKIEAGKLTLSPLDFSLPQLLDEVGAAFRPRFAEKGLAFTETRAPGLPSAVRTDPSRLRQVLFNLLSNALKFTQQGSVLLEVRPVDAAGRVRFEVRDTGVGIGVGELRDIFLAFHQVGESSLAAQGTGLGLAISQRLVEMLGGRIEVVSVPGEGSRFWFDLPLPPVEGAAGVPARDFSDRAQRPVTGYEGAPRRLLLVDDLPENRRVLRDFLQPLGFEIEEAVDGADCLAACERQRPDAVLLDLRLGLIDGYEVARTLRARLHDAPLGIIAISASVFESDRQHAIDAGCDDFLPKPFEEMQLLGTLGRVLGLRWVRTEVLAPAPAPASVSPGERGTLPPEEIQVLLEFSLRGDIVGLRKHLDTLRAAGVSGTLAALVRQLEPLAAAYRMDEIHARLLAHQTP